MPVNKLSYWIVTLKHMSGYNTKIFSYAAANQQAVKKSITNNNELKDYRIHSIQLDSRSN